MPEFYSFDHVEVSFREPGFLISYGIVAFRLKELPVLHSSWGMKYGGRCCGVTNCEKTVRLENFNNFHVGEKKIEEGETTLRITEFHYEQRTGICLL